MAKFEPVSIQLKTGQNIVLRSCEPKDAELLPAFLKQVAEETTHTLQYVGKEVSVEGAKKRWQSALEDPEWIFLGAFTENKLVGQINFHHEDGTHPWLRHNAQFAMFTLKEYWGSGLANELMTKSQNVMKTWGIKRIEATVRTKNERGVAFYKRHGFEIEGTRKSCAEINSTREDEYYIAKHI